MPNTTEKDVLFLSHLVLHGSVKRETRSDPRQIKTVLSEGNGNVKYDVLDECLGSVSVGQRCHTGQS